MTHLDSSPVARLAGVTITYGDVAPDPRIVGDAGRTRALQAELDRRIGDVLLEFAVKRYAVSVSAAEIDAALPPAMRREDLLRANAEVSRRIVAAVRQVCAGESADVVYGRMLSAEALTKANLPAQVPRATFDEFVAIFSNEQVIDAYLRKSTEEVTRQRYRDDTARLVKLRKVRRLMQERNESEPAFWKRMLAEAHAEILMDGFVLPGVKEAAE